MAFRRDALAAIDGFDTRYRVAGDDVDVCWRLQERGGRIGFHAAAMDWHHRRNSIAMYWRQQKGYGKAEALLEEKWPERYSPVGHLTWSGRLYGRGFALPITFGRSRIYGGVWGSAGFQSLYDPAPATLLLLPLMPEWYLIIIALAMLSALGASWSSLLWALPLLALALAAPIAQAALAAARARFPLPATSAGERIGRRVITFWLHLIQPVARLIGRLKHGLTPWRRRGNAVGDPVVQKSFWSETWKTPEQWIADLEASVRSAGGIVIHGGNWDQWDLSVRGGLFGGINVLAAAEEHGAGRQLLRFPTRARVPVLAWSTLIVLVVLAGLAAANGAWLPAISIVAVAAALAHEAANDCDTARRQWSAAVERVKAAAGVSSRNGGATKA
jgi:hypothetical protein